MPHPVFATPDGGNGVGVGGEAWAGGLQVGPLFSWLGYETGSWWMVVGQLRALPAVLLLVRRHGRNNPASKPQHYRYCCFPLLCSLEYEKSEVNSGFFYSSADQVGNGAITGTRYSIRDTGVSRERVGYSCME